MSPYYVTVFRLWMEDGRRSDRRAREFPRDYRVQVPDFTGASNYLSSKATAAGAATEVHHELSVVVWCLLLFHHPVHIGTEVRDTQRQAPKYEEQPEDDHSDRQ